MKKFLAMILAAVLLCSLLALTAFAAGTIGANEQKVLDVIGAGSSMTLNGATVTFSIPDNYYNQAKAYFAGTEKDLTDAQRDEIIGYINDAIALAKKATAANPSVVSNGKVDMTKFDGATKQAILADGQKACAVDNLSLTYDGKTVTITGIANGTVYFNDAPIVKTTGADVSTASTMVVAALVVLMAAGAVVTAKKAQLI